MMGKTNGVHKFFTFKVFKFLIEFKEFSKKQKLYMSFFINLSMKFYLII